MRSYDRSLAVLARDGLEARSSQNRRRARSFGVGELDGDAKAVAEPLEGLPRRERGLADGDEQHAPGEVRPHGFGDVGGVVRGLADVLLHSSTRMVGGIGSPAPASAFLAVATNSAVPMSVLGGRTFAQQQLGGLRVGSELGRRLHQGVLEPAAGSQNDGEDRQADMVDVAVQHRAHGGDVRSADPPRLHVQLSEAAPRRPRANRRAQAPARSRRPRTACWSRGAQTS